MHIYKVTAYICSQESKVYAYVVVSLVRPCDRQPCKNNGECSDDGVKCFKCECPAGFKGFDCSKKGNYLQSSFLYYTCTDVQSYLMRFTLDN